MRTLYLGSKNESSWSLRAWLVLRQAGVPFEERVLRFEEPGWRAAVAELSPSRTIPLLRDGDHLVWDSLAIAEHIAEEHPELWPADRWERAEARSIAAEMHAGFGHLRRELPLSTAARFPAAPRSAEAAADIARLAAIFGRRRGPFLFGRFTIADAMLAPVALRFQSYGVALEGAAADYQAALLALPAMQEWQRDAEREVAERAPGTPDPSSGAGLWAVLFTSQQVPAPEGYAELATRMVELAGKQPGFRGMESARRADGFGITVSYWDSLAAIAAWKSELEHREAQARGRASYYERYEVRVCSVERSYRFTRT